MVRNKNADEVCQEHTERLGPELGMIYNSLWNEIASLHVKWQEYRELYGNSPKRIELLNSAAPLFFKIVQDTLWEELLLSISRLTDPAKSLGKGNLTINALPELIIDDSFREIINRLVLEANETSNFARDWRNRRIAHRDLKLALGEELKPLNPASRKIVGEAIKRLMK